MEEIEERRGFIKVFILNHEYYLELVKPVIIEEQILAIKQKLT